MLELKSLIKVTVFLMFAFVSLTSCKNDPKKAASSDQKPTTAIEDNTSSIASSKKAYEVEIDPASLCYQSSGQEIVQLRYTSDGARIKGVYNQSPNSDSGRTGVITGFLSNNEIKAVYSYRENEATKRQGLLIKIMDDRIEITHPEENGKTIKLNKISCADFKS